jgi:hypothetical protein
LARDRVRVRRATRWCMGSARWRASSGALRRSPPAAASWRMARQPALRHGAVRHASRGPTRGVGCSWACCALPGTPGDLGAPARLVRSLWPLPAPSACPPLPPVPGSPVSASWGRLCPPPRRRRPCLGLGWPPWPADQDRRGAPTFLALRFPPTRLVVDPGGPSGPSPGAVPWCRRRGRSTPRRPRHPC